MITFVAIEKKNEKERIRTSCEYKKELYCKNIISLIIRRRKKFVGIKNIS